MDIPWEDLELFLAVAEEQSFSAAARRLGTSQPTVSRRIGALEERLERALFHRAVEGTRLTEEGAMLKPAALQMARFAKELGHVARGFDDRPAGVVRIAVPPGLAHDFLVPFAADLRRTYPDIQLHAVAGIEHLDLSRGEVELAIRARKPGQPDLMVLAQGRVELGVYASPAYARDRQGKQTLESLDWISWAYPNEHLEPTPMLRQRIENFSPVFASNDFNVQTRAVAEGLGVMVLPRAAHQRSLHPSLCELEVGLRLPPAELYLVCAKTLRWAPRVRAVAEQLVAALRKVEGICLVENS